MALHVVKIGGNVVDNPQALAAFIEDFAALPSPKILVHGGGKEATRLSRELGIPTTMIEGRRVTTVETLKVVTMVYAGLINKRIVAMLQAAGCNALGLSGADGACITARRRPVGKADYGFVGDIDADGVNASFFKSLLDGGITPVVCAIEHDGSGTLLNCIADTVAAAVALGMSAAEGSDSVRLVYCFEQPGVMVDVDDPQSVIAHITPDYYAALKENEIVKDGMIPKLDNAFRAIRAGVGEVVIKQASDLNRPSGTTLTL